MKTQTQLLLKSLPYTAYFLVSLSLFLILNLKYPENWLGLMDGYFYGLLIKTNIYNLTPVGIDPSVSSQYPFYFFYILAVVAKILGFQDLGYIQIIGFSFGIFIYNCIVYHAMSHFCKRASAFAFPLLVILIYVSQPIGYVIMQKPHEFIALASYPLTVKLFFEFLKSNNQRILVIDSLLLAYLLGSYPVLVILPVTLLFLSLLVRVIATRNPIEITRFVFSLGTGIFVLLPFIIFLIGGAIKFGEMPQVTFYTDFSNNYVWELPIHDLAWHIIALSLALVTFSISFIWFKRNITWYQGITILGICVTVFHTFFIYLAQNGIYQLVFPIKLQDPIIICVSMIIYVYIFNHTREYEIFTHHPFGILVGILLSFFAIIRLQEFWTGTDEAKLSFAISRDRGNLLSSLVEDLQVRTQLNNSYYLASDEFRFLDYYVRYNFTSYIPFNESYTSQHERIHNRADEIRGALQTGSPQQFLSTLQSLNIKFLALHYKDDTSRLEYISMDRSTGQMKANEIQIPKSLITKLVLHEEVTVLDNEPSYANTAFILID